MKQFILRGFLILSLAYATTGFAAVDDTRLQDLEKGSGSTSMTDFRPKKFTNCDDAKSAVLDFVNAYYKAHPAYNYGGGIFPDLAEVSMDSAVKSPTTAAPGISNKGNASSEGKVATDFSSTNVQIAGVDEAEIVKTDGRHGYYYNETDRKIYIVDRLAEGKPEVIRKIALPESLYSPVLYVGNGKLTVVATKYEENNSRYYWFNRNAKTAVIVFDLSDMKTLAIDRYFQIDGNLQESRRVGDTLYVLSNNNFAFPYPMYALSKNAADGIDTTRAMKDFSINKVLPRTMELSRVNTASEGNYVAKGSKLPYKMSFGSNTNCSDIEYVLPDAKTMEKYNFTPSLSIFTAIDLKNTKTPTKTQITFGDTSEVFMTPTALYTTSRLYTASNFTCPIFARCFAPQWIGNSEFSIIHKTALKGLSTSYQGTAVVPGAPINQYSMDEGSDGGFRIVTQENDGFSGSGSSTRVSLFDPSFKIAGSLTGIAKGERFQSSRFIGNRLYLVTFEQIDPLFVIDVSNAKSPSILGELKIPGYSTYLHPYDATKLIGIGYGTKQNQWGGTQNAGVKVDLYDVGDVKNPKQLATKTFGDAGSSSDALSNPRLFVWNAAKKMLFLPATLMTSANDASNPYRSIGAFQGVLALSITPEKGVTELARMTHIEVSGLEAARTKDCAQYVQKIAETPKCEKLIGGGEYCPPSTQQYIPPYCYESSPIGEYFANQLWNYQTSFIRRSLYLDNYLYNFSDMKVTGNIIGGTFDPIASVNWK